MEDLPALIQKCVSPIYNTSPQLATISPSVASNVTFPMGSAGPKHFWKNRMACRTVAKTSLVHRFTQVLLNPTSKEAKSAKLEDDELAPASASKLKLLQMELEMDVERLHGRLQQETDLHSALENAIAHTAGAFATFPSNLPIDAQELLTDVAMLEVAVSNLEEQMIGLKMQIRHERNERLLNVGYQTPSRSVQEGMGLREQLRDLPREAIDPTRIISLCEGDFKGSVEQVSDRVSSENLRQSATFSSNYSHLCTSPSGTTGLTNESMELVLSSPCYERRDYSMAKTSGVSTLRHAGADVKALQYTSVQQDNKCGVESKTMEDREGDGNILAIDISHGAIYSEKSKAEVEARRFNKASGPDNYREGISTDLECKSLWRQPNRLSQEMVSCMIGIYCHLADPSEAASGKQTISDELPSPSSPFGHVTSSSFSSLSDLSNLSLTRSPPYELKVKEEQGTKSNVDPYRTQEKLPWGDIGIYSSAVEVSWMSVGKEQLEYAADALRIFRCLVEQLSKVDATSLGHQEKLAFWINVYNALMMHAYLAYGVPKNDVKYFALMQKAAYTVGGHFFNAMAIEHVLLRGKAPSYRPQIALLLALHKLKIPAGASKFAISRPEPLVMFALSCGAWSSPAVRIYTPENVHVQLQAALHDYVRASVGLSRQGKLLVPKLLHCFVRDLNIHTSGEAEEGLTVARWLCTFLTARQSALVQDVLQQRAGHSSSALVTIQPFDFHLRYLFLHEIAH